MIAPSASLSLLSRADGSAQFTHAGSTVLASVAGPMEIRARDERPDAAFIEILVRPATSVAATKDRYLESRLHAALAPIIHANYHPRTLIQINVQIVLAAPGDATGLLVACINAASLALVDGGVPLKGVVVASAVRLRKSASHVFAFASPGEKLVFVESVGVFDEEGFAEALEVGKRECRLRIEDDDELMAVEDTGTRMGNVMRSTVEAKIRADMRWSE